MFSVQIKDAFPDQFAWPSGLFIRRTEPRMVTGANLFGKAYMQSSLQTIRSVICCPMLFATKSARKEGGRCLFILLCPKSSYQHESAIDVSAFANVSVNVKITWLK